MPKPITTKKKAARKTIRWPMVNAAKVKPRTMEEGKRYGFSALSLSLAAGGSDLGCTLYELRPGRRSFPYHYHTANEEAIYVLDGTGTVRMPAGRHTIGPGDYIVFRADASGAHQVINTSKKPLRYLCISTMTAPEIAIYPDSKKIGFFADAAPGDKTMPRSNYGFLRLADKVGYFEGEM